MELIFLFCGAGHVSGEALLSTYWILKEIERREFWNTYVCSNKQKYALESIDSLSK